MVHVSGQGPTSGNTSGPLLFSSTFQKLQALVPPLTIYNQLNKIFMKQCLFRTKKQYVNICTASYTTSLLINGFLLDKEYQTSDFQHGCKFRGGEAWA